MTIAEQWSRSISKERPWWESPLAAALLTAYPFFSTHACSAFPFNLFFPHLAPSLPLWPICCCPVAKSCPAPCKPMDRSMPDSSVLYCCPEFAQIHVPWVDGAIQSSHPLSPSFSSYLQSLPASGSFLMSQVFMSGGWSIGASASASVLPMNIQGWFPLGLTGLISLKSRGLSRVFSNTTVQKHQFFDAQPSLWSNSHIHTLLLEKPYIWLHRLLSAKCCTLLFNTLSSFTIAFLPRSKVLVAQSDSVSDTQSLSVWLFVTPWTVAHQAPLSMEFSRQEYWSGLPHQHLLISRLHLLSAVILEPKKIKPVIASTVSTFYLPWKDGK